MRSKARSAQQTIVEENSKVMGGGYNLADLVEKTTRICICTRHFIAAVLLDRVYVGNGGWVDLTRGRSEGEDVVGLKYRRHVNHHAIKRECAAAVLGIHDVCLDDALGPGDGSLRRCECVLDDLRLRWMDDLLAGESPRGSLARLSLQRHSVLVVDLHYVNGLQSKGLGMRYGRLARIQQLACRVRASRPWIVIMSGWINNNI